MTRARLTLESAPTPMGRGEIVDYHGGQFVVGRGYDADWRVDDPNRFVSRKHFVLSDEGADIIATDASSDGLYVDGASKPLGVGNSVRLEDGMRLRFGEFVAKVKLLSGDDAGQSGDPGESAHSSPFSFDFEPASEPEKPRERPRDMPEPFGMKGRAFFHNDEPKKPERRRLLDEEDPFALDLSPRRPAATADSDPEPPPKQAHDLTPEPEPEVRKAPEPSDVPEREFFGGSAIDWSLDGPAFDPSEPPIDPQPPFEPDASELEAPALGTMDACSLNDPAASARLDRKNTASRPMAQDDAALRASFFRGLGLDPPNGAQEDQLEEMEALGRRFRALTAGLVQLLRARSETRQKARVGHTVIGSSNVNPLKFAVTTEEALSALVSGKNTAYLDPETAIESSFKDLVDHEVRTWTALQTSLRRMVDKFDPMEIEAEMEGTGLLETLVAGGRSAKLWKLYEERYREIATAAEERFLGEIGPEFRDAYENKERR